MKVLAFKLDDETIGLRLDHVDEVVRVTSEVRPLGGAPSAVRGLMDVRGRVVTLLDTPVLMGKGDQSVKFGDFAAVLHEPGRAVGFLLPEKVEILELEDSIVDDERSMDPFVEGVLEGVQSAQDRIALMAPAVILETCRDEVRSRFLTRKT